MPGSVQVLYIDYKIAKMYTELFFWPISAMRNERGMQSTGIEGIKRIELGGIGNRRYSIEVGIEYWRVLK